MAGPIGHLNKSFSMPDEPAATLPTAPASPRMGGVEWALLIGLSVLWGGAFMSARVAVQEVPPFTVVFVRVALGALALMLAMRLMRLSFGPALERWPEFLVMGVLNNIIPFSLLFWGQTQIAAGLASILNATTPLFSVIVAHMLTRDEKATGLKIAGVLAGFAGVAAMMGPEALAGSSANLWAQLACLGAAVSYAFAGVYGRRFRGLPPLTTATGQVSASALMMLPVMLIHDRVLALPMPSGAAIAAILALALLGTALAYIIFFEILKRSGATNVMLVTLLVPVSAILLGAVVLGEALLPRHFAGMAGIALGLALIDGRVIRAISRRR
jgi:drug/metabolite transporter (DMT)-like permease